MAETTRCRPSAPQGDRQPRRGAGHDRPRCRVRGHAPARDDDDLRQPGLDRDRVPDRPAVRHPVRARSARGVGGRDGDRLRARARRAGVRQPAHGRRAGQRDQRDRQRPRLPGAAGDRRRPAGPPADRVRAVPDRASARTARGRVSGLAAHAGPRPGRAGRDRARVPRGQGGPRSGAAGRTDGRLARAGRRTRDGSAREDPPAACGRRGSQVARARRDARRRRVAGARGRRSATNGNGTRVVALAERLRCPVWQEPFSRARRLPAGPPAVRGSPAVAAPADARRARGL